MTTQTRPPVVIDPELLTGIEGGLRWAELDALAQQLAEEADGWRRVAAVYTEQVSEMGDDFVYEETAWLRVPALLSAVGERLDDAGRREIARFLLDALAACDDYDDLHIEVLMCAAGSLGPTALPEVTADIARWEKGRGCFFTLLALLDVGAEPGATTTQRALAVESAEAVLRRGIAGEIDLDHAIHASWPLAQLGHTPSVGLLRQARAAIDPDNDRMGSTIEVDAALDLLEGRDKASPADRKPYWHGGVERWAEKHWKVFRDWLDEREQEVQDVFNGDYESLDDETWRAGLDDAGPHTAPASYLAPLHPVGRNEKCPCGSGKKFKKCCGK